MKQNIEVGFGSDPAVIRHHLGQVCDIGKAIQQAHAARPPEAVDELYARADAAYHALAEASGRKPHTLATHAQRYGALLGERILQPELLPLRPASYPEGAIVVAVDETGRRLQCGSRIVEFRPSQRLPMIVMNMGFLQGILPAEWELLRMFPGISDRTYKEATYSLKRNLDILHGKQLPWVDNGLPARLGRTMLVSAAIGFDTGRSPGLIPGAAAA